MNNYAREKLEVLNAEIKLLYPVPFAGLSF